MFVDGVVEAGPTRGPALSALGRLGRLVDEDGVVVNLLSGNDSTVDNETNPVPFCDSSGDEGLLEGVFDSAPIGGPVLSVLGRLGRLINEDGGSC